jgi:predicted glycosyltransferase
MSGGRVFFYVQHLLGIGHMMRAAALTRAMQKAGLTVTYASGGFDTVALDLGGADVLQLPPVRTADARFKSLLDADGRPIDDEWRERRKTALLDAFERTAPDILLIELFPFGRWPFRFELLPLLEAARHRRGTQPRIVCSLRDILVPKTEAKRLDAIVDIVRRHFDAVLVHGDPDFIRLDETFARAADIVDMLNYTGFIAPDRHARGRQAASGEVVVSAGGGSTGGALLRTALAARRKSCLSDRPWRILAGPNLPARDRAALVPESGVTIEPLRPDFRDLLSQCALSVSQAGYNTVMDLLACGARSVVVPFSAHGQSEQAMRADRLAAHGWSHVVPEETLSPDSLATAIDRAMASAPPRIGGLDLDGARKSAAFLADLVPRSTDREASRVPQLSL